MNQQFDPNYSLLTEAEAIINGPREDDYGSVTESFGQIAALWSAYLSRNINGGNLIGEDVANMMILLKVSRAQNGFHRDSYVDIAGYAGCVEKLQKGK